MEAKEVYYHDFTAASSFLNSVLSLFFFLSKYLSACVLPYGLRLDGDDDTTIAARISTCKIP